jgi:hypothetical protein
MGRLLQLQSSGAPRREVNAVWGGTLALPRRVRVFLDCLVERWGRTRG